MTMEAFDKLVMEGMDILRGVDIQRGLIGKNWEPFNGRLPAKENERCWKCLAKPFVKNFIFGFLIVGKNIPCEDLIENWLKFLQDVNGVVKCDDRNGTIENIINNSGISEETWVKFLD